MKIDQKLWKTDPNRRKFLIRSKQELKNSSKRFKQHKESVQIRITKESHKLLKEYAGKNGRSILCCASQMITGIINHEDNEPLLDYVLTV